MNTLLNWRWNVNNSNWTAGMFAVFRILLGSYLVVHFLHLIPWGVEVFGDGGTLRSSSVSPLMGIVTNPLNIIGDGYFISALLTLGAIGGFLIALGKWDRVAAAVSMIILAWLYQRNPLIANPSLPLLGWMLLAYCFIPLGGIGRTFANKNLMTDFNWRLPGYIWWAGWIVLGVAYSYSGYTKLLSPSWVDGSAISVVLQNPLARDYFLNSFLLSIDPWFLKMLTWGITWIELLFLPLIIFKSTRLIVWTLMFIVQFGFLFLLNFADLTFPMLLIHLLLFDPQWIKPKLNEQETIFYDGNCALCHSVVRFALSEMPDKRYAFSPLQGETFENVVPESIRVQLPDSFLVLTSDKNIKVEGQAVLHVLRSFGGLWYLIGLVLGLLPKVILNFGYRFVAKTRYRLFGTKSNICPIVSTELRSLFLS